MRQGDAQVFGGRLLAASPLFLQTRARLGETGRELFDHVGHQSVGLIDALPGIIDGLPFKVQFPVEVRFTGPDDVWLSHGYGRDSAYVAVHQFTGVEYEPYFRAVEAVCQPLGGRPHWGKLHYRSADDLRPAYEKFDEFVAVRDRLDPARVFTNEYLDRVLG